MSKLTKYCNTLAQLVYDSNIEMIIPKMDSINQEKESSQFFFVILFKLNNGLESLNFFLLNLEDKPQFADSLFICLRTLLLDMLTVDYLMIRSDFKESEVQKQIDSLKYDHIKYSISNLKVYKQLYNGSDAELQKRRKEIEDHYSNFFEKSGKVKPDVNNWASSAKQMITEINDKAPNTVFLSNAVEAFEHYDLYSKYEHLGEYTTQLVFRGFRSENFEELFKEVKSCLKLLLKFHYALLTEFYEDSFIKNTRYWRSYEEIEKMKN